MIEVVEYYAGTDEAIQPVGPTEQQIAALAYALWEKRNRPEGAPDEDWFEAERVLQGNANF